MIDTAAAYRKLGLLHRSLAIIEKFSEKGEPFAARRAGAVHLEIGSDKRIAQMYFDKAAHLGYRFGDFWSLVIEIQLEKNLIRCIWLRLKLFICALSLEDDVDVNGHKDAQLQKFLSCFRLSR